MRLGISANVPVQFLQLLSDLGVAWRQLSSLDEVTSGFFELTELHVCLQHEQYHPTLQG